MEVKILKGTNQIGGCITEITSNKGTKIIIDFGEDLPDDNTNSHCENPNIDGLTTGNTQYDAVFITHSHGDHIGLINYILDDIPIYVEPISKKIYELLGTFTYKKINFKTFSVFPFSVTHSAPESIGYSVNTKDGAIVYMADFVIDPTISSASTALSIPKDARSFFYYSKKYWSR